MAEQEVVEDFVRRWLLPEDAGPFLLDLPEEVRDRILRDFDVGGSKDGNAFGRLQAFANSLLGRSRPQGQRPERRVSTRDDDGRAPEPQRHEPEEDPYEYARRKGLGDEEADFLASLPGDLCATVMAEFDPTRTRDGNIFGRLVGFARSVWARRLGLHPEQLQEAIATLRSMSEPAQARVMTRFDITGTKDGNILARLQSFARGVAAKVDGGAAPGGGGGGGGGSVAPWRQAPRHEAAVHHAAAARQPPASRELSRFAAELRLDPGSKSFLQGLPEDLLTSVMSRFDPSGTKDGNVWGRLFGFVRSVWTQRLGLDTGAVVGFLKSFSEDVQRTVILKFDPSRTKDGNVAARLENFALAVSNSSAGSAPSPQGQRAPREARGAAWLQGEMSRPEPAAPSQSHRGPTREFARRWGLSPRVSHFLDCLPREISERVVGSFNASGTKDGNVEGRLLGFIRPIWSQHVELDGDAIAFLRKAPDDVQMAIMSEYHGHEPGIPLHHFHRIAAAVEAVEEAQAADRASGRTESVDEFVLRCGMDQEAVEFLWSLDPEVRATVMAEFDPGGTKDGNVLGRLRGFTRSVQHSKKRHTSGGDAPRNVRPRRGI